MTKKEPGTWIPDWIVFEIGSKHKLDMTDVTILSTIKAMTRNGRKCRASITWWSKKALCSRKTVTRKLSKLVDCGLIEVTERGGITNLSLIHI